MIIAWKARADFVGVSSAGRFHGETEVPDDATDEQIEALIRADMVSGFNFEWEMQ
jgi:hypothetical protein